MILPTDEVMQILQGLERDDSPPFGNAGYKETNGGWFMVDESSTMTDTDFLIEDCVANECYSTAAEIKSYVEQKQITINAQNNNQKGG